MVNIENIACAELNSHIVDFDDAISYLKTKLDIELKSYGNIIRIALNTIQNDIFENIIDRLNINQELEKELSRKGYSLNYISPINPKAKLLQILLFLKEHPLKRMKLESYLSKIIFKSMLISDINDIDYLKQHVKNKKLDIVSLSYLKKHLSGHDNLIFYSFNGKKDFDFVYNLPQSVFLILYDQEVELYKNQLQKRKQLMDEEINSEARFSICSIKYQPKPDLPISLSYTIEKIVTRIDNFDAQAYVAYREEADVLLDDIEEKINYKITLSNGFKEYLESNDTVFTNTGDLIKVFKLKPGDSIRIYPKSEFAEKLYRVALETDRERFWKVEVDAKLWLSLLKQLKTSYNHFLYGKLKENGLKVLPTTVEGYFGGQRKFPMFNSDLKAIFKLTFVDKSDAEIDELLMPLRKSKTIYNGTMIALGRGLKQEIRLFLKEKRLGEILSKLKFTAGLLNSKIKKQ